MCWLSHKSETYSENRLHHKYTKSLLKHPAIFFESFAFLINKTLIISLPKSQLNAKVCGTESPIFVFISFMLNYSYTKKKILTALVKLEWSVLCYVYKDKLVEEYTNSPYISTFLAMTITTFLSTLL